jgi:hypothetical protein
MRPITHALAALTLGVAVLPLTARAAAPFTLHAADFMNGAPMPAIH